MKKDYMVVTPVDHNGDRYEVGAKITLEDKHAEPLLAVNAICDPKDAPASAIAAAIVAKNAAAGDETEKK